MANLLITVNGRTNNLYYYDDVFMSLSLINWARMVNSMLGMSSSRGNPETDSTCATVVKCYQLLGDFAANNRVLNPASFDMYLAYQAAFDAHCDAYNLASMPWQNAPHHLINFIQQKITIIFNILKGRGIL